MYEFIFRGDPVATDDERREAVSWHRGGVGAFLKRHNADAARALRDGARGVRVLAPYLFQRIADTRTLRAAWDYLARNGGQSPGLDGRRYAQYASAEVWDLCRCLAHALRDGTYRAGAEKVVWISKASGTGQRPVVLLNIIDRVVQRAAVLILQPVLDPLFDIRSFGFRPRRGHLRALARAEWLTHSQQRWVWVADDVRDAFRHVPVSRLLQVVRKLLPADDLMDFLGLVLPGRNGSELRQGGSLSPLALNLYLNHFLDRPWRQRHPDVPLIRMADDLLLLCDTRKQARQAHADLRELLLPAGMSLKEPADTAIHDLRARDSVLWLGFTIRRADQELAVAIAERAWTRLASCFSLAHTMSDAPLRAIHTVRQWINQRGPCYPWSDRAEVCRRIAALAKKQAFEEIPSPDKLQEQWQRAYARWGKLRKKVRGGGAQQTGS